MSNFTKEEVLSCLDCCMNNRGCQNCLMNNPSDFDIERCTTDLMRCVFDVINEQDKNSEKVAEEIGKLTHALRSKMTSVTRYVRLKKSENISDEVFAARQVEYKSYAEDAVSGILSLLNNNDTLTIIEKGGVPEVDDKKCKGKREIAEEIKEEILEALKSNFRAKEERVKRLNEKGLPFVEDGFLKYCNGKIDALTGISDFIDELIKKS